MMVTVVLFIHCFGADSIRSPDIYPKIAVCSFTRDGPREQMPPWNTGLLQGDIEMQLSLK
jgi:hypothetical protein